MQNDIHPDERIVRQVLNGDIECFRVIVSRYQSYIYSIGMRFFRNNDDSNDFVQDVFLKVYNELKSFRGSAPFRSWLTRIAYNFGINRINAKKIDKVIFEESISGEPTPEQIHLKDETINLLRRTVDLLPEQYRVCVDLYFYMGLKYADIESITGYPVNTIKSNVLRAKQILRDKLRGSIAEDYHEM
ncbi:MAG: sigma-70 family RNA polymerase sigma factor [Spirochaetes bacterium]|nr:sigma-70 family RNA polymerase sigma factor [Spirochaetota bacterium]